MESACTSPVAWDQFSPLLCPCYFCITLKNQPLIDQRLVAEELNNTLNPIKVTLLRTLSGLVAACFLSIALHLSSFLLPFFCYFLYLPVVLTAINDGCLFVSCSSLSL